MFKRYFLKSNKIAVFLISFFIAINTHAISIDYELLSLGGSRYEYNYTINNNDISAGVSQFSILFDHNLFDNLQIESSPADWDSVVFQPDLSVPDFGVFDTFALLDPIDLGDSLSGFSVSFDWLGTVLSPGIQQFEVFDDNFNVIAIGNTALVPLPGTVILFVTGLLFLGGFRRHARLKKN